MGPHFAVGDTCYSFAEIRPCITLTAGGHCQDNEISLLKDRYVQGISAVIRISPFLLGIRDIKAVRADGSRIDIRQGRFVLEGIRGVK